MLLTKRQLATVRHALAQARFKLSRDLHAEHMADRRDHKSIAEITTAITTITGIENHIAELAPAEGYVLTVTTAPEAVS